MQIFEMPPGLIALHILPSLVVPLAAVFYLRANRRHRDYGWVCYLTMAASAIWLLIALLYVGDAIAGLDKTFPHRLDAKLFEHPFSAWTILCAPAFPAFVCILVMTLKRRQRR